MLGGDISNSVPGRILVTYDYITHDEPSPRKFLGVVVGVKHNLQVSSATVSTLARLADKVDARMELVVFGTDDTGADEVLADLDKRSWQPFNYARGYESSFDLASDLPYRPEVMGVIDLPERSAGYGTYAISLDYLSRVI